MNSDMSNTNFKPFYNEFWKVIKAFWIPEESVEYWDEIIKASNEVYIKYGREPLMAGFINEFLTDKDMEFCKANRTERHVIKTSELLDKIDRDKENTITLNGEKYIKVDALKEKIK